MPIQSRELPEELDRTRHLHPFTDYAAYARSGGRVYTRGEGIFIYDAQGRELLDGMSGLWCTSLGYSQPKIVDAVTEQLQRLPYYNSFFNCSNDAAVAMANALVEVTPPHFNHVFFTNSGSEANDTNIRLVHRYFDLIGKPDKKIILSRENAYHGSTIAAASLGGMSSMHKQFTRLPYVHHVQQPYWFELGSGRSPEEFGRQAAQAVADRIDELGADNVAAFIAEPVQGAGGVIIPPETYWPAVQRILDERDVLLISDEVICGFGRTGRWFGCDYFGTRPELLTFAKAVTNGYQPLGGVMVGDRIADVLTTQGGEFAHGFTYSGHPACCAAGLATLELYHELDTLSYVADDIAPYWASRWSELAAHPIVGESRTLGMLAAVELVSDKSGHTRLDSDGKAALFCRDEAIGGGLMVRAVQDSIISAAPLVSTREEIDLLIERLTQALNDTARHYGINDA
ncbi:MAG TPA: aminotransferase [Pseudomonadales bacterium]|jgi:putrescine aminotransferase